MIHYDGEWEKDVSKKMASERRMVNKRTMASRRTMVCKKRHSSNLNQVSIFERV